METIKKLIDESDLAIELVDARFVEAARLKDIEKYIKEQGKKFLLVINKIDLISKKCLKKIEVKLRKHTIDFSFISIKNRKGIAKLRKKIKQILKADGKKKCCIFGLPNTGKSSLINLLRGKHVARTSIKPGFTRGYQYVRLTKKILLIDTPGIFVPKLKEELLVFLNAKDLDKVVDIEASAFFILNKLKERYEGMIRELYGFNIDENFFINLAKKFNYYAKENQLDLDRAYKKFLRDWYEGKIKVCFLENVD